MEAASRHAELLGSTIRRLLHRGARSKIVRLVLKARVEDVASALRRLVPADRVAVFRLLMAEHPETAAELLHNLDPTDRAPLLSMLSAEQIARLLEKTAVDDAVSLVETLPPALKEEVLEIVDLDERLAEVQNQLTYRDDSAGRIMDPEFFALPEETTVAQAIDRLRDVASEVDMISYLYVVDQGGHLTGVTSLRQLLLAEPAQTLREVMSSALIKVQTDTDQEEVALLAARYDLLAIPVTDLDNKLVGVVTVDDILDVFRDEATEDFFKLAGTSDDELVYQERSFKIAGIRLPWLMVNLLGLLVAGYVTTRFEQSFRSVALLVGFIPVIMGMAGNVGAQTSTIAVRGLATGRLGLGQGRFRHFLWQQVKVGAVLGAICAVLVAAVGLIVGANPYLPVAVGLSLFFTVQLASINGAVIPAAFKRLGIDPAVASSPLVTTTNDIMGILIYFFLTSLMIGLLAG